MIPRKEDHDKIKESDILIIQLSQDESLVPMSVQGSIP